MELAAGAVIFGIVTGSLYGLAALGLVLVYRVNRVLNFSLAGTASLTSYEASTLINAGLPYPLVACVVVASGAALSALCYGVLQLARDADDVTRGVGTIGLLLVMQGLIGPIWGLSDRTLPEPIHGTVHLGGVDVSYFELLAMAVGLVAVGLTFALLFFTPVGLRMRAVSTGPKTAELLGTNRRATEIAAWSIAGAVGSLAGLLIVPLFQLNQNVLVNFMLAAFAAVVLGGFTSLGGVVLSGITVSVVLNLLSTYVSGEHTSTFTLLLIAAVFAGRPHGLFGHRLRMATEPALPPIRRRPRRRADRPLDRREPAPSSWQRLARGTTLLWLGVAAFLGYAFADGSTTAYIVAVALATFVALLGISAIQGLSGQVSLGQGAFVAIGAYAAGMVSTHLNGTFWLYLPLAFVLGGVAGALIGWPAARLSGVYLVVFTLAFGLAIPELLLDWPDLTGGINGLLVTMPDSLVESRNQFLLDGVVAALATGVYILVARGSLGRRWRAVRDSEAASAAVGWSPAVGKLSAFAFGAALCSLGGALTGLMAGQVGPDGFTVFLSINLVIAITVGGAGSVLGSLLGALFLTLLPYYLSESSAPQVIFGGVLLVVLIVAPEGIANRAARMTIRLPRRHAPAAVPETPSRGVATVAQTNAGPGPDTDGSPAVLAVRGLSVAYGAGVVLDGAQLHVRPGEAVAVVGPNGAGKSTLLRAISGWVRPLAGEVRFGGTDIAGRPPYQVARRGLLHVPEGRCVFPNLSVEDNLLTGMRPSARRRRAELLGQVYELFPKLAQRRGQDAGTLSGGEQQMLAVGRGLMGEPQLLMLDEPSLGLAPVVVGEMFEALVELSSRGLSLLLVEQNVRAALQFADRAYVLSRGQFVMHGASTELAADDALVSAYLVQT